MSIENVEIKGKTYTVFKKPYSREDFKLLIESNNLPDFIEYKGFLRLYEVEQDWVNLRGKVVL